MTNVLNVLINNITENLGEVAAIDNVLRWLPATKRDTVQEVISILETTGDATVYTDVYGDRIIELDTYLLHGLKKLRAENALAAIREALQEAGVEGYYQSEVSALADYLAD